jgi:hypothetical protein
MRSPRGGNALPFRNRAQLMRGAAASASACGADAARHTAVRGGGSPAEDVLRALAQAAAQFPSWAAVTLYATPITAVARLPPTTPAAA